MDIRSYIRKWGQLLAATVCALALHSCDGMIYDYEGDCTPYYQVKFRYDYNMKYANAFANEVESVTLYLLDSNNNVVWQKTESGDILANEDYVMNVDVDPGKYSLLVWCGTKDKGSFTIPESTVATELTSTLVRKHDSEGNAYLDEDIDRLFHGYLADQDFPEEEGTYTYTVSLVKNTNHITVVLQHLSGEEVDPDDFTFTITDNNGSMDWDNALLEDEDITYYAWYTASAGASVETTRADDGTLLYNNAAVAELSTARLMSGADTRLTVVNNSTGETVLSIPFIDYALLVKGYYNRDMDDQEYLDRQDEYSLVFLLDDGNNWYSSYIYINSWKVVLQNTGL